MSVTTIHENPIKFQPLAGNQAGLPSAVWYMTGGAAGDGTGGFVEAILRVNRGLASKYYWSVESVTVATDVSIAVLTLIYTGISPQAATWVGGNTIFMLRHSLNYFSTIGQQWSTPEGGGSHLHHGPFTPDQGNSWQLDNLMNTNGAGLDFAVSAFGYCWRKDAAEAQGLIFPG